VRFERRSAHFPCWRLWDVSGHVHASAPCHNRELLRAVQPEPSTDEEHDQAGHDAHNQRGGSSLRSTPGMQERFPGYTRSKGGCGAGEDTVCTTLWLQFAFTTRLIEAGVDASGQWATPTTTPWPGRRLGSTRPS
jgi:hypothetical protein